MRVIKEALQDAINRRRKWILELEHAMRLASGIIVEKQDDMRSCQSQLEQREQEIAKMEDALTWVAK